MPGLRRFINTAHAPFIEDDLLEKNEQPISRGSLLQKIAIAPLAIGAFAALRAEEAGAAGLSPAAAGYVPVSKVPGKKCSNCSLFIPGKGKVGKCKAVSGAIAAGGYCNLYNAKAHK